MNPIYAFLIEVGLTLITCFLIVGYIRPFLKRILFELCGTEERAQFWTAFSNILLIGLPLIFGLNYHVQAQTSDDLFFEVATHIAGNFTGLLLALIAIGFIVAFFALVAPKPYEMEKK